MFGRTASAIINNKISMGAPAEPPLETEFVTATAARFDDDALKASVAVN
jgi:hypothetical protein